MSLARTSPTTLYWGEVWQAARGQLVVCWGIYIVRDDGLLSFIASGRVPYLTVVLHISFAKITPFLYLGSQTIVFELQMFNVILQFPHLPCLLLMFLLHVLTPMKELIFGRLDHRVVGHCNCVRQSRFGKGNCRSYWRGRATG